MKEHPILFSGPMVRAILEGRKTMTRRIIKPQADDIGYRWSLDNNGHLLIHGGGITRCPYGQPGDRLWVRETFSYGLSTKTGIAYRATSEWTNFEDGTPLDHDKIAWKPSIHMPRWASRITLAVLSVCVERLQNIREEDAMAEGVEVVKDNSPFCGPDRWKDYQDESSMPFDYARGSFRSLWDSINLKRGYGWDANPWVWVVEFKRV